MLTPHSVIPNAAPADDELVVVACLDEKGNTINHYIRDAALKASLVRVDENAEQDRQQLRETQASEVEALTAQIKAVRDAAHAPVLARAASEIAAKEAADAAARARVAEGGL